MPGPEWHARNLKEGMRRPNAGAFDEDVRHSSSFARIEIEKESDGVPAPLAGAEGLGERRLLRELTLGPRHYRWSAPRARLLEAAPDGADRSRSAAQGSTLGRRGDEAPDSHAFPNDSPNRADWT